VTTPSKKTAMIINSNDNHSKLILLPIVVVFFNDSFKEKWTPNLQIFHPSQDFPKIAFFDIWSKMVEFAQNSSQERIIMMATYYQPNLVSKNTKNKCLPNLKKHELHVALPLGCGLIVALQLMPGSTDYIRGKSDFKSIL